MTKVFSVLTRVQASQLEDSGGTAVDGERQKWAAKAAAVKRKHKEELEELIRVTAELTRELDDLKTQHATITSECQALRLSRGKSQTCFVNVPSCDGANHNDRRVEDRIRQGD